MALNALAIDPGRLWKGPWRWFAEDLLDCCVPLAEVRARGLSLDELACLARCNGAEVEVRHSAPEAEDLESFRRALAASARAEQVMVAAYDRSALGQTGTGHFSPIGGYHLARQMVLLLDVARFKYPPHWVAAESLWRAMHAIDPSVGRPRGWLTLRARTHGVALGFTLRCIESSWQALAERIQVAYRELAHAPDTRALIHALRPVASAIELRKPTSAKHEEALTQARAALRALPLYAQVHAELIAVGGTTAHAEAITLLVLASNDSLPQPPLAQPLAEELRSLEAQLAAIMSA